MTSLNLFGHELVVDNFAGGRASEGIEQAIVHLDDIPIDQDATALAMHTKTIRDPKLR